MNRVRIGVLGTASIARRRTLPAMATIQDIEVAAVASRQAERAAALAADYAAVPVVGYQNLLDRKDIDAVYIPLPTGMHREWVARALHSGKHVLAEKPLATSYAEATELITLAREKSLLLRENFMFLHHAQHERVRELLAAGEIGEPRSLSAAFGIPPLPASDVRYRRELGGGSLLDVGVYPVRLAQLLFAHKWEVIGAVLREGPHTCVDIGGSALLRSSSSVTATVDFGFDRHYRNGYEIWGSAGRILVDRAFTPPPAMAPVIRVEHQNKTVELALPPDNQFRNIAEAFAADVLAGVGVDDKAEGAVNSADSILRQAELIDAVRDRARA